jgi:hypothetical protein
VITHYRASWVGFGAYEGPVNYPGQLVDPKDLKGLDEKLRKEVENNNGVVSKAALEKMIREPLAEWGAYEKAPREARLQWYRDVTDILDKINISWATWDYKGGFGIKDNKGNTDVELIEILTGKNKNKE